METNTTLALIKNHIATAPSDLLAATLHTLDLAEEAGRMAAALIVDELASRHPEVQAELDAWAGDLDSDLSAAEVAVAALPVDDA